MQPRHYAPANSGFRKRLHTSEQHPGPDGLLQAIRVCCFLKKIYLNRRFTIGRPILIGESKTHLGFHQQAKEHRDHKKCD